MVLCGKYKQMQPHMLLNTLRWFFVGKQNTFARSTVVVRAPIHALINGPWAPIWAPIWPAPIHALINGPWAPIWPWRTSWSVGIIGQAFLLESLVMKTSSKRVSHDSSQPLSGGFLGIVRVHTRMGLLFHGQILRWQSEVPNSMVLYRVSRHIWVDASCLIIEMP